MYVYACLSSGHTGDRRFSCKWIPRLITMPKWKEEGCVCVCVCMYVYIHIHIYMHESIYAFPWGIMMLAGTQRQYIMYVFLCMYVCMYIYIYIYIYTYTHTPMYVCSYIYKGVFWNPATREKACKCASNITRGGEKISHATKECQVDYSQTKCVSWKMACNAQKLSEHIVTDMGFTMHSWSPQNWWSCEDRSPPTHKTMMWEAWLAWTSAKWPHFAWFFQATAHFPRIISLVVDLTHCL